MRVLLATIGFFVLTSTSAQTNFPDSLKLSSIAVDTIASPTIQQLDSIQSAFQFKSDSLQLVLQPRINSIEEERNNIQHKIDSLTSLNMPTDKYVDKLDSLNGEANQFLHSVNDKLEEIKNSSIGRLNELQLPAELQSQVDKVTGDISGHKLSAFSELDLSNLKLGDLSNLDLGDLNGLNIDGLTSITENLNLPETSLPDIENLSKLGTDQLGNIDGLENLSGISEQVGGYSEDIRSIASGNLDDVKQIPDAIEKEVMQREELGVLTEGTQVLDEYKSMAESVKDKEAMKEVVIEKAKEAAMDHFAGKEQVLNEAMQKMAKYKQKYASVNSIKDLAKKPPNPLKGKPLIERIVPGINFQILKKNDLLIDLNPYAGYRFTTRLTAGTGWNYRIAYNEKLNEINRSARIYGPRFFGEFKLKHGFIAHASVEIMNTNTPPIIGLTPTPIDPEHREWIWGAFAGLKKEYKLFKTVRGTAQILYNLYNPDYKSPYADQINMRFGFEFPMKKKVKTAKK